MVSHLEHISKAHISFVTGSRFSRSCVHTVSKKNFHELFRKLARFQCSHVANIAGRLFLLQWVQNFLKHHVLNHLLLKKLQYRHASLHWQTRLPFTLTIKWFWKHLSLSKDLLHISQYLVWYLVHGVVAVHRDQALSHLCVKSYRVSQALYTFLFAI